MKKIICFFTFLLTFIGACSQDNRVVIDKIDKGIEKEISVSASFHAMLYFRGIPLSALFTDRKVPSPTMVASASYRINKLSVGVWMAHSIDSQGLKNASINIGYSFGNFDIRLWDYYTYSGRTSENLNFFNYDKSETKHFFDLAILYKSKKIPLTFLLGTIVYGSDDGTMVNGHFKNRYSTYFRADYTTKKIRGVAADFHVSLGGVLNNIDNRYFTALHEINSIELVDVGVNFLKTVTITDNYSIPLLVGVVASPMNKRFDGVVNVTIF